MKEVKEFLNDWIDNVTNEQQPNETLEYSEREVLEMLKDYKEKFSLSGVVVPKGTFCECKLPHCESKTVYTCLECSKPQNC
tara:strand:- start:363 stop:605 length:243 start_codon:yes stop_codon:yes gene_type:complete